jgi:hypothetical protein
MGCPAAPAARVAALLAGRSHVSPLITSGSLRWCTTARHRRGPAFPALLVVIAGSIFAGFAIAVAVITGRVVSRRAARSGDPVAALNRRDLAGVSLGDSYKGPGE